MLEAYEQLKTLVMAIEEDVRKAAGGNRAAGTRVRKHMQDIKNKAQELRVKVLENRDTGQTPGATTETEGGQPGAAGA
jgi:hypothetical protein